MLGRRLRDLLRALVPQGVRLSLRALTEHPRPGCVNLGDLRRLTPVSRCYGSTRGGSVDRYYIEQFLSRHQGDVRGRVLEIAEDTYTRRFGGARVTHADILHATADNPKATLVADLTKPESLPPDTYDCVILTQTLLVIYDTRAALRTLHRILKPGGILLATFPGISQISRYDMDRWGDYWRFTSLSARRLFAEFFPEARVTVQSYGNVLAAVALLHGLGAQEFRPDELDTADADYEVTLTVRAGKAGGAA